MNIELIKIFYYGGFKNLHLVVNNNGMNIGHYCIFLKRLEILKFLK